MHPENQRCRAGGHPKARPATGHMLWLLPPSLAMSVTASSARGSRQLQCTHRSLSQTHTDSLAYIGHTFPGPLGGGLSGGGQHVVPHTPKYEFTHVGTWRHQASSNSVLPSAKSQVRGQSVQLTCRGARSVCRPSWAQRLRHGATAGLGSARRWGGGLC